jgi:hypothetical protein
MSDAFDLVRLSATGTTEALTQFKRLLGRRKGLRFSRQGPAIGLELDAARVETLGPVIEAASVAAGVELKLADLDAIVESEGLDARPSRIWTAVGDGADERMLDRERGIEPAHPLLGHATVVEIEGRRVARDNRPELADLATIRPPHDMFRDKKFDDAGWHIESAVAAGQPPENAVAHIALYLTWLIRHDLVERSLFGPARVAAVKSGAVVGADGIDWVDGKLISSMMTDDGAKFSEELYDRYLTVFDEAFAEEPEYSVPGDASAYSRIEPVIDLLWSEWSAKRVRGS